MKFQQVMISIVADVKFFFIFYQPSVLFLGGRSEVLVLTCIIKFMSLLAESKRLSLKEENFTFSSVMGFFLSTGSAI